MLKIKDNVDLKELEKMGFKYNKEDNSYYKEYITIEVDSEFEGKNTRRIYVQGSYMSVVYDLIKAGLVEKVKGGENEK